MGSRLAAAGLRRTRAQKEEEKGNTRCVERTERLEGLRSARVP